MKTRSFALFVITFFSIGLFSTTQLPASPIEQDEGRPRVDWKDAKLVVGKLAFVSGKVEEVRQTQRFVFIDFDAGSKTGFVGVISKDNLSKFSDTPEKLYKDKIVRLRGYINTFQGEPQINVVDPSQVEVLAELPATKKPTKSETKVGETITVGAYNILNLFDDADDPYSLDEMMSPKPRPQMEHVAKTIRELNADVLALEEVENRGILERFIEVFLPEMGYEHVVLFEGNEVRGIDVALISRLPLGTVTSHRHRDFSDGSGGSTRFERDLLQVQVEPPGMKPFEVWVLHLKSSYEGKEYAEPIRRAEGAEVRKQLDKRLAADPKARIIVCGDLNDTPDSATLGVIMGNGATGMKSFHTDLAEDQRVTYNKEPFRTMIDFLLVSPDLAGSYVNGSFKIIPGSEETSGSDHNPISIKLKTSG